jgi:hypothetical protein
VHAESDPKEKTTMSWVTPTFVEIDMSAEIGSYQDDFDPPAEPAFVTPESVDQEP